MLHILAPSEDTGIRAAWGLTATISSVFGACKILQWDVQRLFLLYPQEEKLMQKDLMILHKLFVPFALKVGTAAPFSAQWRTHNIAMLITGHHNNGILKPQSSSSNVSDAFCITGDNVSAVQ